LELLLTKGKHYYSSRHYSACASLLGEYQNAIVIHKNFDEKKNVFNKNANSVDDITEWIHEKSIATTGEYTKDNQAKYKKRNLPILKAYFDVDYGSNLKRTNYYLTRLRKIAEEFKGKVIFTIAKK
jgi:hypothetical protein